MAETHEFLTRGRAVARRVQPGAFALRFMEEELHSAAVSQNARNSNNSIPPRRKPFALLCRVLLLCLPEGPFGSVITSKNGRDVLCGTCRSTYWDRSASANDPDRCSPRPYGSARKASNDSLDAQRRQRSAKLRKRKAGASWLRDGVSSTTPKHGCDFGFLRQRAVLLLLQRSTCPPLAPAVGVFYVRLYASMTLFCAKMPSLLGPPPDCLPLSRLLLVELSAKLP
ncbi:hypothetical protein cyc_00697 [Cyclospora cayetanensis]|uniref:Uncharacterized protein n=1 Tax=Cyclospora cayetanensis TaxID=88456 RepID=A0A1D3CRA2_9EIME|nr:hypothetical protein cyc_00697 [Cyclospora cayetanensis]